MTSEQRPAPVIKQEYAAHHSTCHLFIPLHLNKRDLSGLWVVRRDHFHFLIVLNHNSRWNQASTVKIKQLWSTASPVHSPSVIKLPTANRPAVMWQEMLTKYKKNVRFTAEADKHWMHLPKYTQITLSPFFRFFLIIYWSLVKIYWRFNRMVVIFDAEVKEEEQRRFTWGWKKRCSSSSLKFTYKGGRGRSPISWVD